VLACRLCTEEGKPARAVTSLAGKIYVLRDKAQDQVEVYDVNTYRLQHCLAMPNISVFTDITSCEHYLCLYIGDHNAECVHRLDVQGAATGWPVNDNPQGLSVNAAHNVIVTCRTVCKIKEFSSHGVLLRELALPGDFTNPWHTIQTRSGQLIVCDGKIGAPFHGVRMLSDDGHHTLQSHGGKAGPDTGQYKVPTHLSFDDNEFVFVADLYNCRVALLSPTLRYVRHVASRDQLEGSPRSLYFDSERRFLYVAVNAPTDAIWKGRVLVFRV